MKKVLKYTGICFLALLVLAFTLPILFKGKIVSAVKSGINKNIEAKVDFKDVSLSLFKHFPQLSVSLENIAVTGLGEFVKDTLVSAPSIDASVNFMSLFTGKDIRIKEVFFNEPRIHALVNKEGKANWEITKADTSVSTSEPSAFRVQLEKYAISNGYVYYRDESSDMTAEISELDHEGKGNLDQDMFRLTTSTNAGMASFSYANVPYLVKAKTGIDADFEIDNKKSRYAFSNAAIMVNDLKLVADGFMQLDNDSTYSMDIKFDAPSNEFKNILSLIPAIYQNEFSKLKTSGTAAFKGFVKGVYSPTQIPAYDVNLDIKDGFFQYPDLPQPVKNVQVAAHISNPDGINDHAVIDISKAHLEMGAEPFDFRLLVKNPETTRYIDGVIKGKINLSDIAKFIKLQPGTKLSGLLAADAFAKGNLSELQQAGSSFLAGGFININNLYYASRDFVHPLQNGNFNIALENKGGLADATTINISSGHLEVANDPLDFSLKISRPVTAIDFSGTAKGRLTLDHVSQFMALEPGTVVKGLMDMDVSFSGSKADIDSKNYDRINTTGKVSVANINYTSKAYPAGLQVQKALLVFSPQHATLENFSGRFMNTNLTATGVLDNMVGYALNKGDLSGTMNLQADRINLNDWMGTDTVTTTTSS
ncbi:MAG TPA: AsmA family protein, partial [Flavisolibacter sp.]|nr:AsmA family protein [Flavisolibacter sp.]